MSKVICDICGTTYQDTADSCPICGCSRDMAAELASQDFVMEDTTASRGKGGRFSSNSKKREIFDFDEVNTSMEPEDEEDYPYGGEDYDDDEPRHNTFVVILLTVLIVALLAATAFVFLRYFLPNLGAGEETVPSTEMQTQATTEAVTTEPRIPCTGLALGSGNAELTQAGDYFLLNVIVTPEDTTDDLIFVSSDDSIATVTEDGRIEAVSEGKAVIYITCGDEQLSCPVTCAFVEETEPPTEETVSGTEGEEVDGTEGTEGGETTGEDTAADPNVVLKLKKNDIRLGVYYQFTLELDCDLKPEDVEWSSEHPHIATVDEKGTVTAVKDGTTVITAKYGNQEVQCIVRCF